MQKQHWRTWLPLVMALAGGAAFTIQAQPARESAQRGPGLAQRFPSFSDWHFRAGLGPEFTDDSAFSLDPTQPDAKVRFDSGLRFDAVGGYQFSPYFSLECATGVIYNRIDSIAGSPETDGDFAQIPFLINAVFQAPTSTGFTPFAGAGFGFTVDYLNLNQATIQGYDITGNADTAAFAYQVMAGLAYRFAPGMDISVAYEFLGTTQPEWDVNSASGGPTQTLDLRRPYTHAVVAAVTIQF